jgi:WD40 repeat protein
VSRQGLLTVEWSPDGKRLACLATDRSLSILDSVTGKQLIRRHFRHPTGTVRWRPDWKRLAVAGPDGRVEVWDVSRWRILRTLRLPVSPGRSEGVAEVAWSPDRTLLAVAAREDPPARRDPSSGKNRPYVGTLSQVYVWEVAAGRQRSVLHHHRVVGPIQGHDYYRFGLAWRPDSRRLATCLSSAETWSSRLQIWDPTTGQRRRALGGLPEGAPEAPAWRPDGRQLAAVWQGITIWDPLRGQTVRTLGIDKWPGAPEDWSPEALAWSPDGRYLAARNSNDYYGYPDSNVAPIRLWNVATGERVCLLRQPGAFLEGLAWSPDGTRLACAASDGTLRLWDLRLLSKPTRVR